MVIFAKTPVALLRMEVTGAFDVGGEIGALLRMEVTGAFDVRPMYHVGAVASRHVPLFNFVDFRTRAGRETVRGIAFEGVFWLWFPSRGTRDFGGSP